MKCRTILVWIAGCLNSSISSNRPSKKVEYFPAYFGDRLLKKEGGLSTYNPTAEEERGLEVFLHYADQNFEHRLKIQA
jgi:hypothetical protein